MGRSNLAVSSSLSSASEKVVSKATADVALLSSISCHHVCVRLGHVCTSLQRLSVGRYSAEKHFCIIEFVNEFVVTVSLAFPRHASLDNVIRTRRCLRIRKRVHQLISRFLTKFKICLQKGKITFDDLESSIG